MKTTSQNEIVELVEAFYENLYSPTNRLKYSLKIFRQECKPSTNGRT